MDSDTRNFVFYSLRYISKRLLANVGYATVDYPWDIIDDVQTEISELKDQSYSKERALRLQRLNNTVEALSEWNQAIIKLGNTSNVPDLDEHQWDVAN